MAALFLPIREGKLLKAPELVVCALAPMAVFSLLTNGGVSLGVSWEVMPQTHAATAYDVPDALMAMLNLAAAGTFTTITAVVAIASFLSRKTKPLEEFLLLSLLLLFTALLFRELTHYWFIGLPFAAILCARLFSDDQKVIMPNAS